MLFICIYLHSFGYIYVVFYSNKQTYDKRINLSI